MHASALICLGAGAGLIGGDLREVTGNDVLERSAGVIVVVGGAHGRSVPVLRRFSERLLECSAFSMGDYLIGGQSRSRRNVTTPLINYLAGGTELGRLDPRRLRSTLSFPRLNGQVDCGVDRCSGEGGMVGCVISPEQDAGL
jgi:hypothetical protein